MKYLLLFYIASVLLTGCASAIKDCREFCNDGERTMLFKSEGETCQCINR